MQLSKQDMFTESTAATSAGAVSANVLDFHSHGDDVLGKLFWSVYVASTSGTVDKDLVVEWQTSAAENFSTATTLATKTVAKAGVVAGAYVVKNEPLPKGLKRYNRLKFTEASGSYFPTVMAFVHDGRDEGTPYRG